MATPANAIIPLRPRLVPDGPLARARDLALALAPSDGHAPVLFPDLCIYRFSQPTTFRKASSFGVTLGVVLQGQKRLRIEQHTLSIDAMHLLVITRETAHESAAMHVSPDQPYVGMSLCFGPERVARALLAVAEAGGPAVQESMPAFVMPCDAPIADALERLLRAIPDPLDRKLLVPLAIDEILFRLLRSDAAAAVRAGVGRPADASRVLESMQFIREHHTRKLTVDQLARKAAMSSSHFAHRFSAVARVSPMRYLREVRLDRARALLLAGDARASEVALEVGFESPAHFAREFRRRFGMPPSKLLTGLTVATNAI